MARAIHLIGFLYRDELDYRRQYQELHEELSSQPVQILRLRWNRDGWALVLVSESEAEFSALAARNWGSGQRLELPTFVRRQLAAQYRRRDRPASARAEPAGAAAGARVRSRSAVRSRSDAETRPAPWKAREDMADHA